MANTVEKFNTIAIADIEKINTIASGDIEDLNTLEFSAYTAMVATGGSIATSGDFKVHTFTSSGTFEVTTLGSVTTDVEYLVIAGGGASGLGGGGGAGGYLTATGLSVSAQ